MNRSLVIAAVAAVVALLIGVYFITKDEPDGTQTAEATAAGTASTGAASSEPAGEADPEIVPSFDIVRVEPSGETVMAGRAAPGAEVTVLDGEETLGTVQADETGEWVFIPEKPLAPGAHELGLSATNPDGGGTAEATASAQVPEPSETQLAEGTGATPQPEAQPEPEPESQPEPAAPRVESEDVVVVVVPELQVAEAGAPEAEPEQPIAMLMPRAGEGATRVLQQPGEPGLVDRDLVLNAVDYDDTGRVVISGQAPAGAVIVVYLNNQLIGRVVTDADGHWQLIPASRVAPGLHTLRVDRVDAAGQVVARVETPFARSTVLTSLADKDSFVVVQPGNSLWRIARRNYGEGLRYTVIYQANESQIPHPDLIYPGQVFVVPPAKSAVN